VRRAAGIGYVTKGFLPPLTEWMRSLCFSLHQICHLSDVSFQDSILRNIGLAQNLERTLITQYVVLSRESIFRSYSQDRDEGCRSIQREEQALRNSGLYFWDLRYNSDPSHSEGVRTR